MNPSVTMHILRELAKNGTVDYQDGDIGCTFARFKEALSEVAGKCKVVIVQLARGRYAVTKPYQKTLKKIAAYNIDRDSLYVEPHPRSKQLNTTSQKGKPCDYDYTRLALIIIGTLLAAYGLVSLYFLPTY